MQRLPTAFLPAPSTGSALRPFPGKSPKQNVVDTISNNNSDLNLCSENSAAAMGLQLTETWVTSTAQAMLPLRMEAALL